MYKEDWESLGMRLALCLWLLSIVAFIIALFLAVINGNENSDIVGVCLFALILIIPCWIFAIYITIDNWEYF